MGIIFRIFLECFEILLIFFPISLYISLADNICSQWKQVKTGVLRGNVEICVSAYWDGGRSRQRRDVRLDRVPPISSIFTPRIATMFPLSSRPFSHNSCNNSAWSTCSSIFGGSHIARSFKRSGCSNNRYVSFFSRSDIPRCPTYSIDPSSRERA